MDLEGFRAAMIEDERSPNTVRAYLSAVREFARIYGEPAKESMIAYKRALISERSPKTAAARVAAMNAYCRFSGHPECCVKSVRIHSPLTTGDVITAEELAALEDGLARDGNIRGYWLVRYLAESGMRVSELVRIKKDILISGEFTLWTKGKIRTVRISDVLRRSSTGYFQDVPGPLLFPNSQGGQMTARGCAKNIERWCRRYGVRPEHAHPHGFRHRFALDFLERTGKDLVLLQTLLGHESIETTAIYLKLSEDEVRRKLDAAMEPPAAAARKAGIIG
jgi:integrase